MWVSHVAHTQEREMHSKFWRKNMRETVHLGDLSGDVKMLLKSLMRKLLFCVVAYVKYTSI
jgi:hypothetical protein